MEKLVDLEDEKQRELFSQLLGEAIDKWLDKQYAVVGKWTLRGLLATAFAAFVYFYFNTKGFRL